jgi:FXSXX-COOH protein
MTSHQQTLESAIPDLRDVPLSQLAELRDSVLANSIALYKQRLLENGVALNSFGSSI